MGRFDYDKEEMAQYLSKSFDKDNKVSTKDITWFKFQPGDNIFRIIPEEDGKWCFYLPVHYIYDNIEKNRPVPCHYVKSNKKVKCPACQAYYSLSEEEQKKSRIGLTHIHLIKIVNDKDEVGILQFYSRRIFSHLVRLVDTHEQQGVNLPAEGAFINVVQRKTGDRKQDVEYDEPKLLQTPKRINGQVAMMTKTVKLTEDVIQAVDRLPNFVDIYPDYTVDDIQKMLNGEILDRFKTTNDTSSTDSSSIVNSEPIHTDSVNTSTASNNAETEEIDEYLALLNNQGE